MLVYVILEECFVSFIRKVGELWVGKQQIFYKFLGHKQFNEFEKSGYFDTSYIILDSGSINLDNPNLPPSPNPCF